MKRSDTMTNSLIIASQFGESDYTNSTSMIVKSPERVATLRNPSNASISESSSTSTSSTSHGNFFMRNNMNRMSRTSHNSSLISDSSASSLSSMTPSMIDLSSRRSISDSSVKHCSGSTINYDNKNTMFMMINRSGSSTVKKIIADINTRCDEVEASLSKYCVTESPQTSPPENEIFILAQWAVDSYYRIVIRSNNGIEAIVRAMHTFPYSRGLQEFSCICLGNLCCTDQSQYMASQSTSLSSASQLRNANIISQQSTGNTLHSKSCHNILSHRADTSCCCPASLRSIDECNGVHCIVTAMMNFPKSIAIQSAGCDALRNMQDLIFRKTNNNSKDKVSGLDRTSIHQIGKVFDFSFAHEVNEDEDLLDFSTSTHTSITNDHFVTNKDKKNSMDSHKTAATTSTTITCDDLIQVLTNACEVYINPMQRYVAMTLLSELVNQKHLASS